MEASPERSLIATVEDILRPRRFQYWRTLWQELCSAYRRTEMMHRKDGLRRRIPLHHRVVRPEIPRLMPSNYRDIRICGIRLLLAIHPAATLFDLQVLCQILGPELFDQVFHMKAEATGDTSDTAHAEQRRS